MIEIAPNVGFILMCIWAGAMVTTAAMHYALTKLFAYLRAGGVTETIAERRDV